MVTEEPPVSSPPDWSPSFKAGVQSVIGNVREHNEDSYYIPGFPPVSRYHSVNSSGNYDPTVEVKPVQGPDYLFVVADGMGGQLAGEQASQMAVEIIPHQIATRLNAAEVQDRKTVKQIIREAMAKANQDIREMAGLSQDYINMGTTCVITLFHKPTQRVYVAGIGDSRVYRVRNEQIECLTKDHSLAAALAEAGTIKPEEVHNHKFSHVLYLYLGSPDAKDGPELIREMDVGPGDRYLLASDGLTGVVDDQTLADVISKGTDPQKTADALVQMALDNFSKDNVTCAIVHVD